MTRVNALRDACLKELNDYMDTKDGWNATAEHPINTVTLHAAVNAVNQIARYCVESESHLLDLNPCPIDDGSINLEVMIDYRELSFTIDPEGKLDIEIKTWTHWRDRQVTSIVDILRVTENSLEL